MALEYASILVVAQYGVVTCSGFVGQTTFIPIWWSRNMVWSRVVLLAKPLLFLQIPGIHQTVAILALQMDAVGISMPTRATLSKSVFFYLAKSQKPDLAS